MSNSHPSKTFGHRSTTLICWMFNTNVAVCSTLSSSYHKMSILTYFDTILSFCKALLPMHGSIWFHWRGDDYVAARTCTISGVDIACKVSIPSLMWYNSLWRWRWLLHRLSKRQSLSTTVLFRTTFTRTIILNVLMKWLLRSNLSQSKKNWQISALSPKSLVFPFHI